MKKNTVLIDFFGPDPKSTLMEYKTIVPDSIFLFASDKYTSSRYPEDVMETVDSWELNIRFVINRIDELDLDIIQSNIVSVIERELSSGSTIYVDLTGGHELMIASALHICERYDREDLIPIILDHSQKHIVCVTDGRILFSTTNITIDDYFTARGAKRLKNEEFEPLRSDYDSILSMGRYIFSMYRDWNRLNKIINFTHLADTIQFSLPENPYIDGKRIRYSRNMRILTEKFIQYGFVIHLDGDRYKFRDNYVRDYMLKFGNWLEMIVFIRAREVFDESYLSVKIDWNNRNRDHVDNEIDVVAVHDSVPYFISCKMREVSNYDVYEVGYLASRLAGPRARSIIATTYRSDSDSSKGKALLMRLENMNVGLITADDLVDRTTDIKKVFLESYIKDLQD